MKLLYKSRWRKYYQRKRQLRVVNRLLLAEIQKPLARRDQTFINECFKTIDYLQMQVFQ